MLNGVIEKSTGDLIRAGYCDFTNDGSFVVATEEVKTDIPETSVIRPKRGGASFSRWNGTTWVLVTDLALIKLEKAEAFDLKTDELIAEGFTYDTHTFSLSQPAQINLYQLQSLNDAGIIITSRNISTSEEPDTPEYSLSQTNVDDFIQHGILTRETIVEEGRKLKITLAAATDKAGVDAIVDNRTRENLQSLIDAKLAARP